MDLSYYKQFEPIDGKWYINKELGSGAFGKVFEIERRDFGDIKAALKVVSIPNSQSEVQSFRDDNFDMDDKSVTSYFYGFVEEFIKEFQVMARLKGHSNIVSYEDHDVKEKKDGFGWDIFIRMELLTSMNEHFRLNPPKQSDVIKIGIDICKALEVCQKYNIIHRDIKPSNIFISDSGEYKLGDFGVARTLEKTSSGLSKKGTYTYMAPEVYKGEEYGSNVDIYSLGIVMYKLLNNNLEPFRTDRTFSNGEEAIARRMIKGENPPAPANAEGRLAEIVLKACSYLPKERYESPSQMRSELEKILYNADESKYIYPTGDQLNYEPSITEKAESEEFGTVSMFSNNEILPNQVTGVFEEPEIDEGTVSFFDTPPEKGDEIPGCVLYPVMDQCPKCGEEYPKGREQKYCQKCGHELSIPYNEEKKSDSQSENNSELSMFIDNISKPHVLEDDKELNIWQMYLDFWKKAFDFKGSISRKQYWMTVLINGIISIVLAVASVIPPIAMVYSVYTVAAWVAATAINTRRLHDVGKSGHWQWLCLTGYGAIAVLVFLCQKEKQIGNKYKMY